MPRDGSGVYSLPPGTEATPNTTILSAMFNAFVDDLTTDLNAARPVTAGGTGGTSVITGWDGLAKKGTDIVSASSINLTTATGPSVTITGTATISTVTLAEGSFRLVRAGGAFTWEAGASLLVNGSTTVDVTAAANDLFLVRGGASSVVSVVGLGSASIDFSSNADALAGTKTDEAINAANLAAALFKGTDEASAATVSFGDGGFFHVTGTTTITDIDFDAATNGRAVDVVFDGALTLTHNATTLKLPGGANITTAAGDRARFVQDSTDNVICLWYQRASGAALAGGITLSTPVVTTSDTSHVFTCPLANPQRVTVMLDGVSVSTTTTLLIQIGPSGGVETTGYVSGGSTAAGTVVSSTSGFSLNGGNQAQGDTFTGKIVLDLMASATNGWVSSGNLYETGTARNHTSAGSKSLAGVLNKVSVTTASGSATFDAGSISVAWE